MQTYSTEDIENIFTYHNPVGIDPYRFEAIRNAAKSMGLAIIQNGGSASDIDMAITHLRKATFFAIASIVIPKLEYRLEK